MKRRDFIALMMAASMMLASCGKIPAEEEIVEETTTAVEEMTPEETTDVAEPEVVTDISEFSALAPGSLIAFGEYEGTALEWIVLDSGADEIYCIAKDTVVSMPYEEDGCVSSWNDSTLCYWLNNDFYENAFTDEEKVRIEHASDTGLPVVSEDYKIYLFNRADYIEYNPILEQYPAQTKWWLRSRSASVDQQADYCNISGVLINDGLSCATNAGVRPVMKIYTGDDQARLDPANLIPTPTPTPPPPTPTPEPEIAYYFDGLVNTEYTDLGSCYQFPHINIDTEEIDALNQKIKDDIYTGEDGTVYDNPYYRSLSFSVYHYYDGIYSVVINYNNDGCAGHYTAYTFNSDGHVLTPSEILSIAGLSESGFYEAAADATQTYINETYTGENGIAPVIDHAPNPEWGGYNEYGALLEEDLSPDTLNVNMTMFFDNEGNFLIVQPIMTNTDPHDNEPFITVPGGQRISIAVGFD